MSGRGRIWPGEISAGRDERTGARLWQITGHDSISHGLYFLTDSFLPDEKSLIFAGFRNPAGGGNPTARPSDSDGISPGKQETALVLRNGSANFYQARFPAGDIRQLTDSPGINSFSAVISDDGRHLWFTRGACVVVIDLADLSERVVADLGDGRLGEVSLSADGAWVASAIRFDAGHGIAVAPVDGTGGSVIYRQDRVIIHPQFHPSDPALIEFASDPAPRMHTIRRDGTGLRCLYQHGNDEFVVHETWLGRDGDLVFTIWPKAIMRLSPDTGRIDTLARFNAWHICPSRDGRFILCDTNCPDIGLQIVDVSTGSRRTLCYPASSNGGSQWPKGRYALQADFEEAARAAQSSLADAMSWMDMKTDTVYGPQWTHPHPALSRSGRYATFTSDRTGRPQVYVVEIT